MPVITKPLHFTVFSHIEGALCKFYSEGEFYTVLSVPEGTHQYKYFVDGEWVCHPNEVNE
jgi:hypothetical protein